MGEMRQLRRGPDAEALRQENEQLYRTLAERESALAAARDEIGRRSAEAEEDRLGAAALRQFPFELEEDRRGLEDRILGIQGRYADLERAAREAELQIARTGKGSLRARTAGTRPPGSTAIGGPIVHTGYGGGHAVAAAPLRGTGAASRALRRDGGGAARTEPAVGRRGMTRPIPGFAYMRTRGAMGAGIESRTSISGIRAALLASAAGTCQTASAMADP